MLQENISAIPFDFFDSLFNNSKQNSILIIDENGIINNINKAFSRSFGYELPDIRGKHLAELFTIEDQQKGLPEHEVKKVLAAGQCSDNNYLVSKDKTITWVSGESVLVKNQAGVQCILKVIQDIHLQKTSEISLKNLNEFNEDILRSIEDAVIVLDEQMGIMKANKAYFTLFQNDTTHGQKINFATFINPYDVFGEVQQSINHVLQSGKSFANMPLEITITSGEKKVFDISCSAMESIPVEKKVLVILHDITLHKQVEREREDVIGFVAHELRNPLANLVLCNEIMGESIKENNVKEMDDMLQLSKNNVGRLNRMIAELYDATKTNSGSFKLEVAAFNFKDMVKEAVSTIQILQPFYNIIVKGDGDIVTKGDRYRLIQVITNYLSNGIKYSNGKTDVALTMKYDNTTITVSVQDQGLGISPAQLPHMFQRFFRAEKTKNLEGIGLGLYLCQQIIHAHKGKVWAESEEGKGSTFYFSIPK